MELAYCEATIQYVSLYTTETPPRKERYIYIYIYIIYIKFNSQDNCHYLKDDLNIHTFLFPQVVLKAGTYGIQRKWPISHHRKRHSVLTFRNIGYYKRNKNWCMPIYIYIYIYISGDFWVKNFQVHPEEVFIQVNLFQSNKNSLWISYDNVLTV